MDSITRFATVDAQRVLAYTPPDAKKSFGVVVLDQFLLIPQMSGDLGERLSGFLAEQLHAGAQSVVFLGTDSPTLPLEYVETAFTLLETVDVVFGPAMDGGYYLLGCAPRAAHFRGHRVEQQPRLGR